MNLTMHSTTIELSFHTCNLAFKVLDKEEPGTRVCQKMMSKLQPKMPIFQKISASTCLHVNFHTYTIIYFSDPIIKIS